MNKTVNINIGGLFFHIDEDAYQKLHLYFEAIKRSLSNASGQDEIMKDIEMRVAELLSDRQKSDKHVINDKDVDEIIVIMGQPEDYRIDGEPNEPVFETYVPKKRKLYRDTENGTIAGVCTGLGHYLGIDAVWIKIIFLFFTFFGGSGILAYIIFWIATPEATTTSEKLEMMGEPVTISNIEKKVREEFENVSQKFKNVNYDELGNKVKSGAENAGSKLGDLIETLFGIFAKVIGAVLILISAFTLLGIGIASLIFMFTSSLPENAIINHFCMPIGLETPLWAQGILFLIVFGIPFFALLILGLKLLISNFKSIGNIAKYSLFGIWIIAVGICIYLGINEAAQTAYDGKEINKENILLTPADTLLVKFKNNNFYAKSIDDDTDFKITQDENNREIIYSKNISFEILKTDEASPYLQIEKLAVGKSASEAKKCAEKIEYNYKIEGNQLILDDYLLTETAHKFRKQKVALFLYLPKGIVFKTDHNVENFNKTDDDFFNPDFDFENPVYQVENSKIKCLNCPSNESENDSIKTVSIKINGKTVIETKTEK